MENQFINVGNDNFMRADSIVIVSKSDVRGFREGIEYAKEQGLYLDFTDGQKAQTGIITIDGYYVESALPLDELLAELKSQTLLPL
jgi:regulator of extracellular matrix RemA (YlzA/DUF370 family)